MIPKSLLVVLPLVGLVRAHGSIWHPSMYGFNVTATNSPQYGSRDNRPQAPLRQLPFDQWWMHGHLDQPPHPNDIMELPAGGKVTTELSCDKDATSYWPSGPGGDQQSGNDPCPGQPIQRIHTNGLDDLGGCALAIAYKSDVNQVQPEDLVVFSINHRCLWDRFTDFQIPANMPACPDGKCICAWFWQHREDAGGDEMYMNGFQCNVTGATATTPIPRGQVPVRCVDDPSKCVKGAKQPFYWDQAERNNMFDNIYAPPLYLPTYGFADGAQNDIWDTVGGSSGAVSKSVDSSSSTSAPAVVSTSVAVVVTSTQTPEATSTFSQQPETTTTTDVSSEAPATSTPVPQAQSVDPTTSASELATPTPAPVATSTDVPTPISTSTASLTQGGQGHRTCRAKKHKRHARRQRRARAL
ncbi:unnamed protein product [Rhizoctonia solani]|uniref:Chitin-binding type-4 domain-containing protein n=1 Tax=Rhizoctonia solani TaxID=456999 RepID=A0A8H3E9N0_9AGAM|nr:unnamed protein product [Rhizoctonia solani]